MARTAREALFECTFHTGSRRYQSYVRAWDRQEAAEIFELELRQDGVDERGTLDVRPLGGAAAADRA